MIINISLDILNEKDLDKVGAYLKYQKKGMKEVIVYECENLKL